MADKTVWIEEDGMLSGRAESALQQSGKKEFEVFLRLIVLRWEVELDEEMDGKCKNCPSVKNASDWLSVEKSPWCKCKESQE